jgi:hypothetical protein
MKKRTKADRIYGAVSSVLMTLRLNLARGGQPRELLHLVTQASDAAATAAVDAYRTPEPRRARRRSKRARRR